MANSSFSDLGFIKMPRRAGPERFDRNSGGTVSRPVIDSGGIDRINRQANALIERQQELERRRQQQQAQKRQQALAEINDKLKRIAGALSKAGTVRAKLQPLAQSNFAEVKNQANSLLNTLTGLVSALNNAKNQLNRAKASL